MADFFTFMRMMVRKGILQLQNMGGFA